MANKIAKQARPARQSKSTPAPTRKPAAAKSVAVRTVTTKPKPAKPAPKPVAAKVPAKAVAKPVATTKSKSAKTPAVRVSAGRAAPRPGSVAKPAPRTAAAKQASAPAAKAAPAVNGKAAAKPAVKPTEPVAAKVAVKPAAVAGLAAGRAAPPFKPTLSAKPMLAAKPAEKAPKPKPEPIPVKLPPAPVRSDSKMARNQAGISPKELEHFRDLLFEKRRELLGDVSSMETSALRSGNSNLSTLPMHMADTGTDNYEQEFTLGLVQKDRELLRDINKALAKIQDGSYGICEGTGKPISKPRLEAQPWAKYSIEHARSLERPQFRRAFG